MKNQFPGLIPILMLLGLVSFGCRQRISIEEFQREYNSAVSVQESGKYQAAERAFREIVTYNVSAKSDEELEAESVIRSASWNNLGTIALQQGDLEEASRSFEESVNIYPGNAQAYNNIGGLRLRQGRYEEALEAYDAAMRIDPYYVEAINNLANILIDVGQYDRAGKLLDVAIELDIYNERSVMLIARMYAENNNLSEDSQQVRAAWLHLAGYEPEDRARVATQYLSFGQPGHARAVLQLIKRETPSWPGTGLIESRILAAEGRYSEAKSLLSHALQRNPLDGSIRNDLVTVLLRSGRTRDAVSTAWEGTEMSPSSSPNWYTLGLAYEEASQTVEAESAYGRAVELEPEHVQALINLAVLVATRDDAQEAVKLLEKALHRAPNNLDIYYNLGRILVVSRIDYQRGLQLLLHAGRGRGDSSERAGEFIHTLYEGVRGMDE